MICGFMKLATAEKTGTATELLNCLYARVSDTGMMNESGKPISRAHSRGVSLLGFLSFCAMRISEPSL